MSETGTDPNPDEIGNEIKAGYDDALALKQHTDDVNMAHIHSQDKDVLALVVKCYEVLIKLLELVETKEAKVKP